MPTRAGSRKRNARQWPRKPIIVWEGQRKPPSKGSTEWCVEVDEVLQRRGDRANGAVLEVVR